MKILWVSPETTGIDDSDEVIRISGFVEDNKQINEMCLDLTFRPSIESAKRYLSGNHAIYTPPQLSSFQDSGEALALFCKYLDLFVDRFDKEDKLYIGSYNSQFAIKFIKKLFVDNGNEFFGSYFSYKTIDVMSIIPIVQYYASNFNPSDFKLDTVYNYLDSASLLSPMNTMPDYDDANRLPDKVKKTKLAFDGLMKYLTDIPY